MTIAVAATKQVLANAYAGIGTYLALCTADPGTTSTVGSEASGGSYARKQFSWTQTGGGVVTGSSVTFDVPAGTYTYVALCSAATGAAMFDKAQISPTTLGAAGKITVNVVFTQT